MICFSFYMAYLWGDAKNIKLLGGLFALQWILNASWNPVFFYFREVGFGLAIISALTLLVGFFLFFYWSDLRLKSLLVAPYLIWLMIATSLNAYILINN
jgi:benzodiazapine receptor